MHPYRKFQSKCEEKYSRSVAERAVESHQNGASICGTNCNRKVIEIIKEWQCKGSRDGTYQRGSQSRDRDMSTSVAKGQQEL